MDIDIYQQCPCHAEKKIKFCCGKDIVTDLNQILAKNSAGQHQAALDQLDRTIKKTGPRDCLLTIQTHIQITHGEIEAAKVSNAQFLANNPNHSTGLHHLALIHLAEGNVPAAVDTLQDAMEAITGNEIPASFSGAFRMVGLGLLNAGHLVGARAHLEYALSLKNENDDELRQMALETFRLPNSPLLLKQDFKLAPLPEEFSDTEWAKKYINAGRSIDRGQFRRGLKFLKKIDSLFPDLPIVVRGMAVLHLYLGNLDETGPDWLRFSKLPGLSEIAAIEASSIGQLFSEPSKEEIVEIKRFSYELTELDSALEIAGSTSRLLPSEPVAEDPFQEGRPPRSVFMVLDREPVKSAAELTIDNASEIAGEILFYGKQTDRPARLEWISAERDNSLPLKSDIEQWFAAHFSSKPDESVVGETERVTQIMNWNWHFPEDMTQQKHEQLMLAKMRVVLLEQWTEIPLAALDGITPHTAATTPELRVPLQALLLRLDEAPTSQAFMASVVEELRNELGVPTPARIPWTFNEGVPPSPIELRYLDYANLSDDDLLASVNLGMMFGNLNALKQALPELANRPEVDALPRDRIYLMLARMSHDLDTGLDYLAKARAEAKKHNRSAGMYLVEEFEFRIARGSTEKLPALMQTIQMHHLDDPDVEYRLGQVLERYGLIKNGTQSGATMPAAALQATNEPGNAGTAGLWGPDSKPPATLQPETPTEPPQGTEPSKLWIPD